MLNNNIKRTWTLIALIALIFSVLPTATSTVQAQVQVPEGDGYLPGGPPGIRWGLDRINQRYGPPDGNAEIGSILGRTGAGVHVFIVDSGINTTHQEFNGRIGEESQNFVPITPTLPLDVNNTVDPNNIEDCHGHGTGTASIIGGQHRGIAPNVTIHVVRVYSGCKGGTTSQTQIAGITYVADTVLQWRQSSNPEISGRPVMAVLNIGGVIEAEASGSVDYILYQQALERLVNQVGVPTFATAHNYNTNACGPYGANAVFATIPNLIIVGAINTADQRARATNNDLRVDPTKRNRDQNGSGTGWGRCVDLFAPNDGDYVAAHNDGLYLSHMAHLGGNAAVTDDNQCYTAPTSVAITNIITDINVINPDSVIWCAPFFFGGSSSAMPQAAGVAALWLEQNPGYGQSAAGAAALERDLIKAATKGVLHNPRPYALEGGEGNPANLGPGSPNRLLYAIPTPPEQNTWGLLRRYLASNDKHWISSVPLETGAHPFVSDLSFTQEGAGWGIAEGHVVNVTDASGAIRQPWLPEDEEAYTPLTRPLYGCIVHGDGAPYMMPSTDECDPVALPNNHPQYRHMQLGHIYINPYMTASLAIYRCKRIGIQDHYVSEDPQCENSGFSEPPVPPGAVPIPLGFVSPLGKPMNPEPLRVNGNSPAANTTVPANQVVPSSVAFNKPINPSTLSPQTVQVLANGSSTNLVNSVSFDSATNVANLQLNGALPNGTYTIIVDASIEDSFGNPLGTTYQSAFQVGHPSTINWINPEGGYWHEPENWSTGTVPGPNDFAVINYPATTPITVSTGTHPVAGIWSSAWITMTGGTLDVSQSALFSALTLNGGTLRSTGPMEMRNVFNWGGGYLEGSGSSLIPPGGTMVIDRYTKYLRYGHRLITQGTTVWVNNNYIYMNDGVTWENYGTFTINTDYSISAWSGAPINLINHSGGVIRKTTATGSTYMSGLNFTNHGTLDIQSGEINFSGALTHTGRIQGTTAGQLYLSGGTHTFTQYSSLTVVGVKVSSATVEVNGLFAPSAQLTQSSGTLIVNGLVSTLTAPVVKTGGTLTLNSPTTALSMTLNGGTLNGTGTLTVTNLAWGGGYMDGPGHTEIPVGGSLTINRYTKYLRYDRTLTVRGSTLWTGTNYIYMNDGVTWNNYGTFTINTDYSISAWSGAPISFINHSGGVIRKTTATGSTYMSGLNFTNDGTLDIQSGEINFSGVLTHTGAIQGTTAGQLYLSGGTSTLTAGSSVTNIAVKVSSATVEVNGLFAPSAQVTQSSGTLILNGSVSTLTAPVVKTGGTLTLNSPTTALSMTLNGGTLNGTGTLNVTDLAWGGGYMDGPGHTEIPVGGSLTVNRYTKYLRYDRTLTVRGSTLWTGTNYIYMNDGVTWNNYGTFTINTDYSISAWSGAPINLINHSGGVIRKTTATGSTYMSGLNFTNDGTLDIQSGEINFSGVLTHTGAIQGTTAGQLYLSGGTSTLAAGSSVTNIAVKVSSATVEVNGSFAPSAQVTQSSGTLILNGSVSTLTAPVVKTGGTLTLNSPTTALSMTLNGGTLNGTGTLTVTDLAWGGGYMDGPGHTEIPVGGSLTINRYTKYLRYDRTLTVRGSTLWTGTNYIYMNDGVTWNNYGTFTINTDYSISAWSGDPISFINHSGAILRKIGGTGTTTFSGMTFTNNGTIDVQSGTLDLPQ